MQHVVSPGQDASLDRQGYLKNLQTSVAFSPDGIHWTAALESPLIPFSDTPSSAFRDPRASRYVSYLRYGPPNTRMISRIESEDFIHWSPKVTLLKAGFHSKLDAPYQTIHYRMAASPYEGFYIGLIAAYHGETTAKIPPEEQSWRDKVNLQLTYSRNGVTWMRVGRNGVITAGELADANRDWKMESEKATFLG